uniref:Uncharacterized protein n=1 Tax=Anguilla anguilla TaxID=7936 RepID=A0A0E9RYH8_ANGAN
MYLTKVCHSPDCLKSSNVAAWIKLPAVQVSTLRLNCQNENSY